VLNDIDPQNQIQTVTPQTTTISGKGTLVLSSTGTYTFTPVNGFVGPVEFPYIVCDNGAPIACAEATLYILTASQFVFPVVMTSFTAEDDNCNVLLKWTTSQEINSSHFNIMRKRNNDANYSLIAKVNAKGNSASPLQYSYTDTETGNGTYFYYLETVDIDQYSELSETRVVQLNCGGSLSVYPNPATDQINISIFSVSNSKLENTYEIRLTDLTGRTIALEKYVTEKGTKTVHIPTSHLAAGQYHLTVKNLNEIQTFKVQVTK